MEKRIVCPVCHKPIAAPGADFTAAMAYHVKKCRVKKRYRSKKSRR